ncbi:spore germination protein [Bacillus sp. FJAT-29790]|uniref:spore germination protein n=1 Tax=Bacillus sp. FJAT-29790 TaxID=1895002 RepID=UPI001C2203D4|nr:spore germination protein [Bacillus sp. FJAT-29790]MBU8880849.1 spore germination protein [Bacillus sp. FJAT-29790]
MVRHIRSLFKKNNPTKENTNARQQASDAQVSLSIQLDQNIEYFRSLYLNSFDVMFRSFLIGEKFQGYLIYIDGLTDVQKMDEQVLTPLMKNKIETASELTNFLVNKTPVSSVQKMTSFSECVDSISNGNPILLCHGINLGFSFGLAKWEKRSIEEPAAESGIRGPREGFTETIGVNTSLIRRIIKSPALKMKTLHVGEYTKTKIFLSYIEGIADQTLIEEVENRIKRIKIDGILESNYIEEFIEDNTYSPFPQILSTERPDVVSANLLEGRVAILIDGTPFVLIAPTSLFSLFQSQEDYYGRYLISSVIRMLRFLFLTISLLLPSLYVAILTYHQEMVPTALLLSIASARESVPFPALVEAIMMELTFEALREAGVRLPKQIGSAVSIVGALVIGQAAVQAGLVSAPMVIVVAVTGIASFMIPRYAIGIGIRMLRFPIILLAGSLGLIGVMMGIIAIIIHLATLRSFGVPYLSPIAPLKIKELKDSFIRAPLWKMNTRPHFTGNFNQYRQSPDLKPGPEKGGE